MKVLNCVPNISEGTERHIIEAVEKAARSVSGVKIISVAPDPDHNRTVYSILGEPEAVLESVKRLADKAIELIDMSKHKGSHPRIGAVDVTPFIPISDMDADEALVICRQFGAWVGAKGIPVYYYEYAATKPERVCLPDVRKGQYEGLRQKLADPQWQPDEGPAQFVQKSGAFLVSVRMPLIAYNVNLWTEDIEIADRIAKAVRHKDGGYRYVRAMAVKLPNKRMVQVSMNLINYMKTPIPRVTEMIRQEAAQYGIRIAGTEIIGAIPVKAVEAVMKYYLQCHEFSSEQILEMNCIME